MKYALILLSLITGTSAFAQKNFLPAYVVFNNNDTLHGQINYRGWEKNPRQIEFRTGEEATIDKFDVGHIRYFEVLNNDAYKRAIVKKDMVPVNVNELEEEGFRKDVIDTAFLRVISSGKRLSLLQLVDQKVHFFVQENDKTPEELIYRVFFRTGEGGSVYRKYTYRDQLKKYATGPEVVAKIDNALYNEKDLIALFHLLDNSTTALTTTEKNVASGKAISLFVGVGAVYSSVEFLNEPKFEGLGSNSISPALAVGMNIGSKRNLGRLFTTVMLAYSGFDGHGQEDRPVQYIPSQTERRNYDLKLSNINLGIFFNYSFYQSESARIYLSAGMGGNYTIYHENKYSRKNITTGTQISSDPIPFQEFWMSFGSRLGYTRGKFDVSLNRKLFGGFNPNSWVGVRYNATGLLVAYSFSK